MLVKYSTKIALTITQKLVKLIKSTYHDDDKYIATPEFNK